MSDVFEGSLIAGGGVGGALDSTVPLGPGGPVGGGFATVVDDDEEGTLVADVLGEGPELERAAVAVPGAAADEPA